MKTWIFQGNPQIFDINKYLQDRKTISWSLNQRQFINDINIGDIVFVWRSDGDFKGSGGIVARAIIVGKPVKRTDEDAKEYWLTDGWSEEGLGIPLDVLEVKFNRGFIKRTFLKSHPLLGNLSIISGVRNLTNYLLNNHKAEELKRLWNEDACRLIELNEIPQLTFSERDREYKSYPEKIRDEVVYEYIFNGQTPRWLDENIIGLDPEYSRGWQSMGILHFLGLRKEFKGIFSNLPIIEVIRLLNEKDKQGFKEVISALVRFSQNVYSEESFELFLPPEGSEELHKRVGTSQYTDGVRIDKEFHDDFNPPSSPFYVKRGEARNIKVLFNNKVFNAEYRFENQTDKTVFLQSIRFRKELKKEFRKVFPLPEGEFTIQRGIDINHFVFSFSADSVSSEEDENEYPEGKVAFKTHRIRERNREVVNKAKKRFKKKNGGRLFCEACGFDFLQKYGKRGEDFIEGHHTKLISEMKEGEKTKIADIRMLCSNCHRMIHRTPFVTVEELANLLGN